MPGEDLHVEEREAALAQPLRAGRKRDFRGPGDAVEHRFSGEHAAHGDAVQSPRQALAVPDLDAVRPPEAVQLFVGGDDVGRDPRSLSGTIAASLQHALEVLVEGDPEVPLQRAPDGARPGRSLIQRKDGAGIGRCPRHQTLAHRPGKDPCPVRFEDQRRRERSAHRDHVFAPPGLREAYGYRRRLDGRIRNHDCRCITEPMLNPHLSGLSCFHCGASHDARKLQTVCVKCGMPLRVEYALERFVPSGPPTLWRYERVLPIGAAHAVTLGEGFTPLLSAGDRLLVKDESRNPTGSFKARGMAVAVSMAKTLGARALAAPSAGNAAGALAAYGARAGLPVTVAMPEDTPTPFFSECELYGATVHRVKGTIADAGKFLREHGPKGAFDVSTLREPYRIEGKKTMAYELVEQMGG